MAVNVIKPLVKALTIMTDIITLPIHLAIQRPWNKWPLMHRERMRPEIAGDFSSRWSYVDDRDDKSSVYDKCQNVPEMIAMVS